MRPRPCDRQPEGTEPIWPIGAGGPASCTGPISTRWRITCPAVRRAKCAGCKEVIDCWFDSGSMPFAQWHYPFENKELFEEPLPRQFHLRGHGPDPRLVLHPAGHLHPAVRSGPASKTAWCWAMCRIRTACKMSKHLGNVVEPRPKCWKSRAPTRCAGIFYASSAPWLPSRFSAEARQRKRQRQIHGHSLEHLLPSIVLYADIDGSIPPRHALKAVQAFADGSAGCSPG